MVVEGWPESSGRVYTLKTHVGFTLNNQIIPHTCIIILVSNDSFQNQGERWSWKIKKWSWTSHGKVMEKYSVKSEGILTYLMS